MPISHEDKLKLLKKAREARQDFINNKTKLLKNKKQISKPRGDVSNVIAQKHVSSSESNESNESSDEDIIETREKYKIPKDQIVLNRHISEITNDIIENLNRVVSLHTYQVDKGKICHIEVIEDLYHTLITIIELFDKIRFCFLQKAKGYNNRKK